MILGSDFRDPEGDTMELDPSAVKIWNAWVGLGRDLTLWDPYGAALTLLFVGLWSGYMVRKFATDTKK